MDNFVHVDSSIGDNKTTNIKMVFLASALSLLSFKPPFVSIYMMMDMRAYAVFSRQIVNRFWQLTETSDLGRGTEGSSRELMNAICISIVPTRLRLCMITQLNPPLPLATPKGGGWAHFVIDYGPEDSLLWVVFMDADGACWVVPNAEVRMRWNWTIGRRKPSEDVVANKNNSESMRQPQPFRPTLAHPSEG